MVSNAQCNNVKVATQTLGLSTTDAAQVVALCGKLARGFKTTFVAVIHAPRASVFAAFTDLILLAPVRLDKTNPVDP